MQTVKRFGTILWTGFKELAGRGAGTRKWEGREKRRVEAIKRFEEARDELACVFFSFFIFKTAEY
jgi:hypothetical protein